MSEASSDQGTSQWSAKSFFQRALLRRPRKNSVERRLADRKVVKKKKISSEDLSALKDIYTHIHKEMMDLRSLIYQITAAYIGVCGIVVGWLSARSGAFVWQRYLAAIFASIITLKFIMKYVRSFQSQFNDKALVINKIERIWGAYDEGKFGLGDNEILFPDERNKFGTEKWTEGLFKFCEVALYGGNILLYLAIAILLSGDADFVKNLSGLISEWSKQLFLNEGSNHITSNTPPS